MKVEPPLLQQPSQDKPGFTKVCQGLLLDPKATLESLYKQDSPPYIGRILTCLFLSVFSPIAFLLIRHNYLLTRIETVLIFNIILIITATFYIFLEALLLKILKVDISLLNVLAAFAYGLVPLIPLLILCYLIDLYFTGRLSVTTFVITGIADPDNTIISNFFYAHLAAKILFLVILFFSLRILDKVSVIDSIMITLLSSIPFYLSYFISVYIAEFISPGSTAGVQGLLHNTLEMINLIFSKS